MNLTTPNIADACLRLGSSFNAAPPSVRPLFPAARCMGRALPVKHSGSVSVFFEAFDRAEKGDVLVIDNDNRMDEGCIGDLTVLEALSAGIAGIVLWGAHRDTVQLLEIGLPLFSTGTMPVGPRSLRPPSPFDFAGVTRDHTVIADADGVLFVPSADLDRVLAAAKDIADMERGQADAARRGVSLRSQFEWSAYLERRSSNPQYTLREHLATIGRAIEV